MHAYQDEQIQPARPERIQFHATGSEYFRIWIVNLLLTILTLGIYSAWAKVRRNQYFYASTALAGGSFEYHGKPMAILKGRIVATVLVAAYGAAGHFSPLAGLGMAVVMMVISPWFIQRSLQFRLHNTSYRGIRFRFAGQTRDAYRAYLWRPLMNGFTLGLATPWMYQRAKAWQHNESRFGTAHFFFDGGVGGFFKVFYGFMAAGLAGLFLMGWFAFKVSVGDAGARAVVFGFLVLGCYAWLFLLVPLLTSYLQNLVWNHTRLEQHQFHSDMKLGRLIFITVTNYLAVICTLGLFLPFAKVRSLRYRLESISVQPQGSLDDVLAANGEQVGALGEGLSDVMDFDFSL